MNINFDDRQNVKPNATRLQAPNVYEDSKALYNAERAGFAEIGRAAQNASAAIAQCGDLLMRYDQEMLNRNFATDKRSLDIEYAKYYQEERLKLRNDPNQPKTVAEFQERMSQINETVRTRIGEWKQKNFRNYERWEEELDGIAEAQAGNAMLKATEDWLGEQNRIEAQKLSSDLSFYSQYGTIEDVDNAVAEASKYNPRWAEVYAKQGEATKSAISVRDLSADVTSVVNAFTNTASAELSIAIENASNEQEPEEPEDKSRKGQLLWRRENEESAKQKDQRLQADYYKAAQMREVGVYNELSAKIDSNPYLNDKQKESAKKTLRGQLREQTAAVWQQYKNARVLEQQERTAKVKASLSNGDIDRLAEFRHLNVDDSVLNPEDHNEAAFKFIDDMAESQKHKTAAFIAISSLAPGSASFGDEAIKILEDARLRGVTKSDYAEIRKTVSDMAVGRVKMDDLARNNLNSLLLSKINEAYGTEFSKLQEAIDDEATSHIVDDLVIRLSKVGYSTDDFNTAVNIINGAFAESLRANDSVKVLEVTATHLRDMVAGTNKLRDVYSENAEGLLAARANKKKQQEKVAPVAETHKQERESDGSIGAALDELGQTTRNAISKIGKKD